MGSEKFCLRWNDFESNISSAFRELRDDKDFFDVTLACDDEQLQAHKVIISACSPFFRNILRRNPHKHPLLYLKGVKYSDLQSVLNFMYHGEVNVAQEELNSFLAVAEDLKVKGLTQNQSTTTQGTKREIYDTPKQSLSVNKSNHQTTDQVWEGPPPKRTRPPPPLTPPAYNIAHNPDFDDVQEIVPVKPEPVDPIQTVQPTPIVTTDGQQYTMESEAQAITPADDQNLVYQENYEDYGEYEGEQEYPGSMDANKDILSQLDAQISSMMYKTDQAWHCGVCDRTSKGKINISRHIEATHLENHPGLNCDICGETVRTRNALRQHKSDRHRQKC